MPITVARNFGPLTDAIRTTKADWYEIGLLARERILQRTRAGRDVKGQAFAPYSEDYAAARRKEGIGRSGVKLELSGEMLRSIQIDAEDDRVTLSF
jgi:hypothetical protein